MVNVKGYGKNIIGKNMIFRGNYLSGLGFVFKFKQQKIMDSVQFAKNWLFRLTKTTFIPLKYFLSQIL